MKWFDRWFYRKWRWAWENRDAPDVPQDCVPSPMNKLAGQSISVEESWGDGLRMNVRKLIGGYVISFRHWDRKTDRTDERHYIITDEQDFERELGKMITMESMRHT